MAVTISPTQDECFVALQAFLSDVTGIDEGNVIQAQQNRTPEPTAEDFIVMTPILRPRLRTNVDSSADATFIGSISGLVLTVTDLLHGEVVPGRTLYGPNVADGTIIGDQITGDPGGVGTYAVAPSQNVPSQTFAAGAITLVQGAKWVVQIDVHGGASSDNAMKVSTIFRDEVGVEALAPLVSPLFAEGPRQVPFFVNESQQYEWRWSLDLHMQVNETVTVGQQYADALVAGLIEVDTTYPVT